MEYTQWASNKEQRQAGNNGVLILVVMEYTQWGVKRCFQWILWMS